MCMSRRFVGIIAVMILPWLAGCVTDSGTSGPAAVEPVAAVQPLPAQPAPPPQVAVKNPSGIVRLRDALALTLLQNPELSTSAYDIRAAEARTIQAGLIPNPEVTGEVEDFGGTGERRGFSTAQSTLSLSQLIELGSKRTRRIQLARTDEALAGWDYEAKRLDVLVDSVRAFVGVLAAQRKVALAQSLLDLDQQIYGTVVERVKAGSASPLEEQRAQVAVANSRVNLQRDQSEL